MGLDVAIIGGGANGTGLLRDLQKRGLQVALFEKGDFARGATGASSGMIHGGPRYLLDDTETTRHSCEDSGFIQKIAGHLLFRVPFVVPFNQSDHFGKLKPWLADAFFDVYDRFAVLKNGLPHARLSATDLAHLEPGLRGDFTGAVTFDEWGIDPGRLCVLGATDAIAHGAKVHTYTDVVGLMRGAGGAVVGVRARAEGESTVVEHPAKVVVNCAGPWAQRVSEMAAGGVRLRPGKGVHLIYEKRLTNFAVVCEAVDGREVFVMPYQNETWIGTTDDDYYGDADDLWATADEIRYLQQAVARILPAIEQQRLIGVRVGLRNTIFGWGKMEDALSRRYEVIDHSLFGAAGLFSLAGGKLASFRVQAEEAADAVCRRLGHRSRCTTHRDRLPGGDEPPPLEDLVSEFGISSLAATRLLYRHGSLAPQVATIGRESPTGFTTVCCCEPVLECELRYCVRHEHVVHLADLALRTRLAQGACQGLDCARRAAQIFAEERSLDATDERIELMGLLSHRWRSARPVLYGHQLAQAEALMMGFTGLWQFPQFAPIS